MIYRILLILSLSLIILTGCSSSNNYTVVDINNVGDAVSTSSLKLDNTSVTSTTTARSSPKNVISPPKQAVKISAYVNLPVLFASQAPLSNWDSVHEEMCEEASMVLTSVFYNHQGLTNQSMEDALQKVLAWETKNGYSVDVDAGETVKILGDYFGLSAKLETNVTVDRLKYELSLGHLILVPAAGRELHNPNFTGLGPIYHMLVIRGYDDKNFITNDVGTRKGNGYKYSYQTLIDSIHDWNHDLAEGGMTDQEMVQGAKVVIVVDGVKAK